MKSVSRQLPYRVDQYSASDLHFYRQQRALLEVQEVMRVAFAQCAVLLGPRQGIRGLPMTDELLAAIIDAADAARFDTRKLGLYKEIVDED